VEREESHGNTLKFDAFVSMASIVVQRVENEDVLPPCAAILDQPLAVTEVAWRGELDAIPDHRIVSPLHATNVLLPSEPLTDCLSQPFLLTGRNFNQTIEKQAIRVETEELVVMSEYTRNH
jgi:hypothetical protein